MAAKTFSAWVRALERAGLQDLYRDPRCRVSLVRHDGRWHAPWSRCVAQGAQQQDVYMVDLVNGAGPGLCDACSPAVPRAQKNRASFAGEVDRLREAHELAGQVLRFAGRPGSGRGRSVELARKVSSQLTALESLAGRQPDMAGAAADIGDRLRQALDALTERASSQQVRDQLLATVREVLVPRRFSPVTLEEETVLVGLWPHRGTNKDVQEIIDAFSVPVSGGATNKVVLRCPRFVVDYINRTYSQGGVGYPLILTVPAAAAEDSVVEVAAVLWEPGTRTPMADLATALEAARNALLTG